MTDREKHYIRIDSHHNLLDLKLREVWRYRDLIWLFTKRSFQLSYKQTVLGPVWFFISPIFSSVVYTILFTDIAKISTEGIPAILFYMGVFPEVGNAACKCAVGCDSYGDSFYCDNHSLNLLHCTRAGFSALVGTASDSCGANLARYHGYELRYHRFISHDKIPRFICICRLWHDLVDVRDARGLSGFPSDAAVAELYFAV